MIKGCVFDVGNTLINDTELVKDSLEDMGKWLERKGILRKKQPFITTYHRINKSTFQPYISHTFGEEGFFKKTFEELKIKDVSPEQALQKYRQFLTNRTSPDDEVIETFKFLRRRKIKVALLTNERIDRIEAFIEKTKIGNLLDAVVVSEQVQMEKPDPAIFVRVCKRLGLKCQETVMFGDDEIADGGAKQVGMKFVLVTAYKTSEWQWETGPSVEADYVLKKINEKEIKRCLEVLSKIESSLKKG